MNFENIPEWLGGALIAAVAGITGYLGKSLHGYFKSKRSQHSNQVNHLKELAVLLEESRSLFIAQNFQARRLIEMLADNHPGRIDEEMGFEETFTKFFNEFTPQEKNLHAIIRSITESAQRRVNQAMSEWLKNDLIFKNPAQNSNLRKELSEQLRVLELHLNIWHAKYNKWIPDCPQHSLVYLADEEQHGVAFPAGIEQVVEDVLSEIS
jgi:hypothetical protein